MPAFSCYSPIRNNRRPSEVYELSQCFDKKSSLLYPRATHDESSYSFYMVKELSPGLQDGEEKMFSI